MAKVRKFQAVERGLEADPSKPGFADDARRASADESQNEESRRIDSPIDEANLEEDEETGEEDER